MTQVEIGGSLYPATVTGRLADASWSGRESKEITLSMPYADAAALFVNGAAWSIVLDVERADGTTVQETYDNSDFSIAGVPSRWSVRSPAMETYDNSDFSIAGDLTDHRDGTVTVKMGKPTELENTLALLLGGEGNV